MVSQWQEREQKVFMTTGGRRLKITVVKGEGARAWDDAGREYLDFVGGWAVTNLGHCHPVIVEALTRQARQLLIASNDVYTVPQVELGELLVGNSCLDRVFFCNSGAEANEGAVKLARKYGKTRLNGAYQVITAMNSFHGRTLAMVAATGHPEYQTPYTPLPEGFINVEYDNVSAIKRAATDLTCAVMLEPIQGEGGVNIPADGYFKEIRAWCDERGILLILDEVQTGCGRTGTLFGYQQLGIEPDVMTLGKGLGGGIPIAAILAKESCNVFQPGDHGTTYGGNPLSCAVAYASFKYILENDITGHARQVGEYFKGKLQALQGKHPFVKEVRGRGLLLAMEFDRNISMDVVNSCLSEGFMVNPVRPNAIRFMPPLIITEAEVDEAIGILDGVLGKVTLPAKA